VPALELRPVRVQHRGDKYVPIRMTKDSARNAAVSALLDPALSSARDALQRFLERELKAQHGADWQATLERDRMGGQARPSSDRWDWGTLSYRLGHFRAPQAGFAGGVVSEPLVALARLAKAYRNLFQHEELSDAQVRHAVEGLALLHEALGSRALAEQTRAALEAWAGGGRLPRRSSTKPSARRVKAKPRATSAGKRRTRSARR
jgi:hypothetical protein